MKQVLAKACKARGQQRLLRPPGLGPGVVLSDTLTAFWDSRNGKLRAELTVVERVLELTLTAGVTQRNLLVAEADWHVWTVGDLVAAAKTRLLVPAIPRVCHAGFECSPDTPCSQTLSTVLCDLRDGSCRRGDVFL